MFHLGVQPKIQVIKVVKITTVKKQTCTRRRKCGRYKTQTVNDRQTARGIKCGQALGYENTDQHNNWILKHGLGYVMNCQKSADWLTAAQTPAVRHLA